ncbi:MAG TPA: SDR family NAD(P)-dependent oxidoreductase [Ktedonobacterales bacterium]
MATEIRGRVALISGASRGIGAAIARRLAAAGAAVAVGYGESRAPAEHLAAELAAAHGVRAVAVGGNLTDPEQVAAMARATAQALGPVDILVSNAGIAKRQSFEEITVEDWDDTMALNLRAAFLLAQRLAPDMRNRRWGRIVFISSAAAFTGGIIGPHYTASKAALIGLAHALAKPLAPHGVTVNAVAPALIGQTGMIPGGPEDERLLANVPVGRFGKPEEVADAVFMLVANPFITAQTIAVDGGLYPR